MEDGLLPNLDDINKKAFCIPYNPIDTGEQTRQQEHPFPTSPYKGRDFAGGQDLRFVAYRAAWTKCLERMKSIIHELHEPSSKAVVQEVKASYHNVLPGLPYPELPVVTVINPAFGSTFLNRVTVELEDDEQSLGSGLVTKSHVTHLYATDFTNLQTGIRSMIAGFVEKSDILDHVKRKPSTSLANYDIKYLVAWYKALVQSAHSDNGLPPNLVVVLHDFEQFDPLVMQDIFYICSTQATQLPIIFLLSLSSPSPNYMHDTYPRSTMTLLRIRNFIIPSGIRILQEILLKTFFDVDFEPNVMIGPAALEYLVDYFTRYNSSTDAVLTILQLTHLKHFSSDPLAAVVQTTPPTDVLSLPGSFEFLDALIARLSLQTQPTSEVDAWSSQTLSSVVTAVDQARTEFYKQARNLRIGFGVMLQIQGLLEKQGHKGLGWSSNPDKSDGFCLAMIDVLRGNLAGDVKLLGVLTRKLRLDELLSLLEELHSYFHDMPTRIRSQEKEQEARTHIIYLRSRLSSDSENTSSTSEIAKRLSEWLTTYLTSKLTLLEGDFWDVWYTGESPFPSELLNPSNRASLLAGLLRPHDYSESLMQRPGTVPEAKSLWELPDTSILFKRYLDSGKMINVYDWFESFQSVLETQRTQLKALDGRAQSQSPRKRGRSKATQQQPVEILEDEEKWKIQVQARFIRAMHELDYLGFIKHTGRKADHVLRTVFDIDDAE